MSFVLGGSVGGDGGSVLLTPNPAKYAKLSLQANRDISPH